ERFLVTPANAAGAAGLIAIDLRFHKPPGHRPALAEAAETLLDGVGVLEPAGRFAAGELLQIAVQPQQIFPAHGPLLEPQLTAPGEHIRLPLLLNAFDLDVLANLLPIPRAEFRVEFAQLRARRANQ